jgi:N-acetylglucosamine kinase-like BadF-type ATPase
MTQLKIPLLVVDGGGTKCLAIILDREGKELGRSQAGSCNYHGTGVEASARELKKALSDTFMTFFQKETSAEGMMANPELEIEIECAVFGMAGLDTTKDFTVIENIIKNVCKELSITAKQVMIENDGLLTLYGETNGKPGVLLIAGTGSIACGINNKGESARVGGWGHRIGDEGSGFWIGKQAIQAILQAYDGRGEVTKLTESILSHLHMKAPEELVNWVYSKEYSVKQVSALTYHVNKAAEADDAVANKILSRAAEELCISAEAIIQKLCLSEREFSVVLQGGVLKNIRIVRQKVEQYFQKYGSSVQIDTAKREPIHGGIVRGLSYLASG